MTPDEPERTDARWLPRTGDRLMLLSHQGRSLTAWRITQCEPVPGTGLSAFTLTVAADGKETGITDLELPQPAKEREP